MCKEAKAPRNPATSPMTKRDGCGKRCMEAFWPHATLGFLLLACSAQVAWGYSGGLGSRQAPYLIANADDLLELGQNPRDYDKHFLLTADIDLSAYTFDQAVIAAASDRVRSVALGDGDVFSGTINGNGHVVQNLTMTGTTNLGLIGAMGLFGQVYGLGIVDANIVGTDEIAGMLVAYNEGRISHCFCAGSVRSHARVGGLVGENHGQVANSYAAGRVSGTGEIGGLTGSSYWGDEIVNCYSTCRVIADDADAIVALGGLTGSGDEATGSFWDTQTSGVSKAWPGIGLGTEQMQTIGTFLEAGWDFQGEATNGCRETWIMPNDGGYPILSVFQATNPVPPVDCGVTIGQCALPVDANEVLWDSAARFSSVWDTVALTRTTQNPAVRSDEEAGEQDAIITVSGRVQILDANNLVGMDTQEGVICQAIDTQGNSLMPRRLDSPFDPVRCWDILPTDPRRFTVQLQLDPGQALPGAISQLDFYVYALYAQALVVVDIPFAATEDWIDMVPGFRVFVEKALSVEGDNCEFVIREDRTDLDVAQVSLRQDHESCDPIEGDWSRPWPRFTQRDLVYHRDMIDAEGKLTSYNGNSSSGSGGDINEARGTWYNCGGIATIRYTIAVRPYRLLVPLTLTDIPVQEF